MIKSTKTSLKFSNNNKKKDIREFINEYKNIMNQFVDLLWELDDIPKLINKDITSKINTNLSQRIIQCAGKQASGIIRGTKKKQNQRLYIINKLQVEGKYKQARKLQVIYDNVNLSKPNINDIKLELDSRFIKIDLDNKTSFDGWLKISSLGNRQKLVLPFKKTRHFNKLNKTGTIKKGIRLSKKEITFIFDLPDIFKRNKGNTIGIDIGKTTIISCSNNYVSKKNDHGYDLNSIINIISRKKRGSKNFKKVESHRKNYINWSINQLNLKGIKQVNLENIKYLRKGRKTSRKLSHWTYTDIFNKLESYCIERGVHVQKVNPVYTSQRCSKCGWVRKTNRKSKSFKCGQCNFALDADLNAAKNISLPLISITKKQRLSNFNKTGFYWN